MLAKWSEQGTQSILIDIIIKRVCDCLIEGFLNFACFFSLNGFASSFWQHVFHVTSGS